MTAFKQFDYQAFVRWFNKYPILPVIWILFIFDIIQSHLVKRFKPPSPQKSQRILIIKLAGLGDSVLMLGPVRSIRKQHPHAYIEMFCSPSSAGLFYNEPAVDHIRVYDLFGSQRGMRHFIRQVTALRQQHFDMVCDFEQHTLMVSVISWFTGASKRVGLAYNTNNRKMLLTDIIEIDGSRHMSDFYWQIAARTGATVVARKLGTPFISPTAAENVRQWMKKKGITTDHVIIGIHPGSSKTCKSRRWFPERFAELIDELHCRTGAIIVLTGTDEEAADLDTIQKMCDASPIINRGEFDIQELACLIACFSVFISNDTGPMHLGPAVGTPTIGLFGPGSPLRYKPLGRNHRALHKNVPCSPCIHIHLGRVPECKMDRPACMDAITVEDVLSEVLNLLHGSSEKHLSHGDPENKLIGSHMT